LKTIICSYTILFSSLFFPCFIYPHKKNLDPKYYNRDLKWLKVKVRRVYNRRKLDEHFQADLKRLFSQLLVAAAAGKRKKNHRETY